MCVHRPACEAAPALPRLCALLHSARPPLFSRADMKIRESSQTLLSVLKRESTLLTKKKTGV